MELTNNDIYDKQKLIKFVNELKLSRNFRKNREEYLKIKFDCGCVSDMRMNTAYKKAISSDAFYCRICSLKQTLSDRSEDDIKKIKQKSLESRNKNYIDKYGSISDGKKASYNKRKETLFQHYGVENVFQLENVKQKIKETNLEKYGVEYISQNAEIMNKIIATKNSNDPGYKKQIEKLKNTFNSRYGSHPSKQPDAKCFISKNKNWLDRIFASGILEKGTNFEYHKLRDETGLLPFNLKCPVCKTEFSGTLYGHIPSCPICNPYYQTSKAEQEIADFIRTIYNGVVICNDRSIITPKELDIYLPEISIAIEYDGIYWHADDPKKQIIKTDICAKKGIRLIHIFENEWLFNKNLVKDMIRSIILKSNKKIYARNCIIKELSVLEAKNFCVKNHIQGYASSSVRLGLFYQDELVQLMTFGKSRFNKKYEWEIIRECSESDLTIIGGKSKIFKYFERHYKPMSIVSYCDRRYFNGESYLKLGMTLVGVSLPSYFYIKGKVCLPRYKCQKHKLKKLLPLFNPTLSETDNMILSGYHKIYDCGNLIFVKNYNY